MKLFRSQPTGLWYIIAVYMWEYFSYYGMRSLLILFLTQDLFMKDHQAENIYGSYTALVYLTPLLGGFLADKVIGMRNTVILGAVLMVCGHIILGFDGEQLLFLAMAFIICGYGYFKSNIPCLLGQLYEKDDQNRDTGFTLMYLGGNIGGILAPLVCGYVAYFFGDKEYAFTIAGIGMAIGLGIFWMGKKHIPNIKPKFTPKKRRRNRFFIACLSAVIILFISNVIKYQFAGWLILVVTIGAFILLSKKYIQSDKEKRRKLHMIFIFMAFGMFFWMFDEQMGSSIQLFADRNLTDTLFGFAVPSSVVSAFNPMATVIGGLILAKIWQVYKANNEDLSRMFKFMFGFVMQLICFLIFIIAATIAMNSPTSQASVIWVIMGLAILGFAELFIDPIALSEITALSGKEDSGFLAAMYFLTTGSIASYLASKLAQFAAFTGDGTITLKEQAELFLGLFYKVGSSLLVLVFIWLIVIFLVFKVFKR